MADTYLAWDGKEYDWPPPAGWALKSDGRYWPAEQGPSPSPAAPPAAPPPAAAYSPPAPSPGQPMAYQPGQPAQKKGIGCAAWILIGIGVVLFSTVAGCVLLVGQVENAVDEFVEQVETGGFVTEDASLDQSSCEIKDGRARIRGSLTNTYSERADFDVRVRFLDEDGLEFDSGAHTVEGLGSGDSDEFTVGGFLTNLDNGRSLECELTSVYRVPQFLN